MMDACDEIKIVTFLPIVDEHSRGFFDEIEVDLSSESIGTLSCYSDLMEKTPNAHEIENEHGRK